jgi:D-3-phosphoglycerate dehydrogenase
LKSGNIELDYNNDPFDIDLFESEIENYDALIIGAHTITKEQMKKAKKLKLIAKHGAGLDNIDINGAKELGIKVTNAPGTNSNAVADITFGLIIDCARKISVGASDVKSGKWKKLVGVDVYGKSLGLIGFGSIAKGVAKRAKGFDMKVLAYDPFIKNGDKEHDFVEFTSFENVVKNADYLSVHVPLNEETKNLINNEVMMKMKKGSFIINTSRGTIVNEKDLFNAVSNGHIAGAGLDVTEVEPPVGSPLLNMDNVVILPHLGMYSVEAIDAVSILCARNVYNCFNSKELINEII